MSTVAADAKHSGRRHGLHHRRRSLLPWWAAVAALVLVGSAVSLAGSDPQPVADDVLWHAGAQVPSPTSTSGESGGDPADPGVTDATPSDPAAPVRPVATATSGGAVGERASRQPRTTSAQPSTSRTTRPRSTRTSHPAPTTRRPPTTRPPTTPTPTTTTTATPTPTVKPCKVGCVLVRQTFEDGGTHGWRAASGQSVAPFAGGASGKGSLHASGLTTTSGPSLVISDRRLAGADRRWVSVSLRVRVDSPAHLRLQVDGAQKARVLDLAADGRWRTLRAWFLPDGPVTLTVVAAPSSCASGPRVPDVYLDDLVVSVTTPELALSGQASPAPVCW